MSEEKKIIIDEDWKTQVQAEKEALKTEEETEAEAPQTAAPGEMPPASFELLVTTLASEAMVAMGQIPHPVTNEASVHPAHARYAIDMLEVLQAKTKGNLESHEDTMLTDILHQLRMMFIAVSSAPSTPPPQS